MRNILWSFLGLALAFGALDSMWAGEEQSPVETSPASALSYEAIWSIDTPACLLDGRPLVDPDRNNPRKGSWRLLGSIESESGDPDAGFTIRREELVSLKANRYELLSSATAGNVRLEAGVARAAAILSTWKVDPDRSAARALDPEEYSEGDGAKADADKATLAELLGILLAPTDEPPSYANVETQSIVVGLVPSFRESVDLHFVRIVNVRAWDLVLVDVGGAGADKRITWTATVELDLPLVPGTEFTEFSHESTAELSGEFVLSPKGRVRLSMSGSTRDTIKATVTGIGEFDQLVTGTLKIDLSRDPSSQREESAPKPSGGTATDAKDGA